MSTQGLPVLAPESLEAFEKYFRREPLNDELAAIQRGEDADPPHPAEIADKRTGEIAPEIAQRGGLLDWTPSRVELRELAELRTCEGWDVLMRLLKKRLEILRERAINGSQIDPLGNQGAIAQNWAYHGMYGQAIGEIEPMVMEQLERLKVKE
jgi:hypothetical protein